MKFLSVSTSRLYRYEETKKKKKRQRFVKILKKKRKKKLINLKTAINVNVRRTLKINLIKLLLLSLLFRVVRLLVVVCVKESDKFSTDLKRMGNYREKKEKLSKMHFSVSRFRY
mgnify:CR=1 FL=1